jgi:hypothetical protein
MDEGHFYPTDLLIPCNPKPHYPVNFGGDIHCDFPKCLNGLEFLLSHLWSNLKGTVAQIRPSRLNNVQNLPNYGHA